MHHHLNDLLFIKRLLSLVSFLEVLEVFKVLVVTRVILHYHLFTHAIGHGKLLLLLDPISMVVF